MTSRTIKFNCFIMATILASGLVTACAPVSIRNASEIRPLTGHEIPTMSEDDLLGVSDEMKDFVDLHLPPSTHTKNRWWKLTMVVSDKYLLDFDYNPSLTLTAQEAFQQGQGNCLSYSLMLVALARYAGIPAKIQEVELPADYRAENSTFINNRHVNVRIGDASRNFVVDVSGRDISETIKTRDVTIAEARSQYYNNLGVNELLAKNLPAAWARFEQALDAYSRSAYVWSNLGVVYNRNNQVEDAKWAYQTALDSNNGDSSALNNLYTIYQQEGQWLEASELAREVDRHRKRNPYYLAMLADEMVRSRQYNDAIALLKRSIRINREEFRFHGALAEAHYLAGNHDKAFKSLDVARALAPADHLKSLTLPPH